MFPHEEHLLKALKETDYRIIVILQDLAALYVTGIATNEKHTLVEFQTSIKITQIINKCAADIAELKEKERETAKCYQAERKESPQ